MAVSSRFASPVNDATEEQLRLTHIRRKPRVQPFGESAYGMTGLLREQLRLKRLVMRKFLFKKCALSCLKQQSCDQIKGSDWL